MVDAEVAADMTGGCRMRYNGDACVMSAKDAEKAKSHYGSKNIESARAPFIHFSTQVRRSGHRYHLVPLVIMTYCPVRVILPLSATSSDSDSLIYQCHSQDVNSNRVILHRSNPFSATSSDSDWLVIDSTGVIWCRAFQCHFQFLGLAHISATHKM